MAFNIIYDQEVNQSFITSGDAYRFVVTATGAIIQTDGNDGIEALGSNSFINVAGSIVGNNGINIYEEGASIVVGATGSITGTFDGITNQNPIYGVSIINAGSISGSEYGVNVYDDGDETINNSGSITGGTSIFIVRGGLITNSGKLIGSKIGIDIAGTDGESTYISNSGTISGSTAGIDFELDAGRQGALTVVNSGTIESNTVAFAIETQQGVAKITNSGTIDGDVSLSSLGDTFDGRKGTTNGIVYGNAGNDILYTGAGGETLYGGADNDKLYGGAGNDVLDGGTGADYLNGGSGEDIADYEDSIAAVRADLPSQSLNAGDAFGDVYVGIEDLTGSAFSDTLLGDANANVLVGGAGGDTLYGRAGDDYLYGGADGDTLNGGAGNDYLDGGDGTNLVTYSDATAGVTVNLSVVGPQDTVGAGIDTILNVENVTGSAFADTLTGDANTNILTGGAGADVMTGGDGSDIYYVDNAGDKVVETSTGGYDTIYSSVSYTLTGTFVEQLVLTGAAGLKASGNSQFNNIVGNDGANIIDGRGGSDYLTGNGGADKFLFDTALSTSAFATITDFTVGQDMIELDRTIFTAITANGTLATSAFVAGTSAANSSQHILYDSSTGDIFYDSDGNGSAAAIRFAHVAAGTALTAASVTAIT